MTKMKTIDELLIKNGVTHLTGKEHDGVIATVQDYAMQHSDHQITQRAEAIARVIECKEKIEILQDENDKLKTLVDSRTGEGLDMCEKIEQLTEVLKLISEKSVHGINDAFDMRDLAKETLNKYKL